MSVPKLPLGWMNATVVPRLPGRGALSMAVAPAASMLSSATWQSVTDVVQAFATLLDGLRHRAVVSGGGEQLHVALGHLQQCLFDAVALDHFAMVDGGAERLRVVLDGGLEVLDGDGDVIDFREQHEIQ
jgi:hypothetical protein